MKGLEGQGVAEVPWCITCDRFYKWPGYYQCVGCLTEGRKPKDTWTVRTVHWDTQVLHAVIRRQVQAFEAACPGWELVPDMQRLWEDTTHPSKYVDRETPFGRKQAWTRFRVDRRHPRGRRAAMREEPVEAERRVDVADAWGKSPLLLGVDYGGPGAPRSAQWLVVPGQAPVRMIHAARWGQEDDRE